MQSNPYLCSLKKLSDIKLSTVSVGESYRHDTDKVLFLGGWSIPEKGQVWSEGNRSSVLFKIDSIPESCNPFVKISGMTLREQLVSAYINGVEVNKEKLNGRFESVINIGRLIASDKTAIRLDFDLPGATIANSRDPRVVAIALTAFSFGCSR
ncbi:hypothetical protein D3C71_1574550 [compost metagenome]